MVDQDLLSKLKGLRGIMNAPSAAPNERENAKVLYNRLVTKYHVSESEFLEEEFELVQFHCANEYENKLAVQICCKVTNEKTIADYSYRKGFKEIVFKVTKTQAVEMRKQFELYRKDLTKEMEQCYVAFVHANDIFSKKPGEDNRELTQEELAEIDRMFRMSHLMTPTRLPAAGLLKKGRE